MSDNKLVGILVRVFLAMTKLSLAAAVSLSTFSCLTSELVSVACLSEPLLSTCSGAL